MLVVVMDLPNCSYPANEHCLVRVQAPKAANIGAGRGSVRSEAVIHAKNKAIDPERRSPWPPQRRGLPFSLHLKTNFTRKKIFFYTLNYFN